MGELFHVFADQEERRAYGGSAFIELQYCCMPPGTPVKKLTALRNITFWKDDSLYVDDDRLFWQEYSDIFDGSLYRDGTPWPLDIFGINYYPPARVEEILAGLRERKPADSGTLITWLEKARACNGVYILGI